MMGRLPPPEMMNPPPMRKCNPPCYHAGRAVASWIYDVRCTMYDLGNEGRPATGRRGREI